MRIESRAGIGKVVRDGHCDCDVRLHATVNANQKTSGTWGYRGNQNSVESTCLAILALRPAAEHRTCAGGARAPGTTERGRELVSVHR